MKIFIPIVLIMMAQFAFANQDEDMISISDGAPVGMESLRAEALESFKKIAVEKNLITEEEARSIPPSAIELQKVSPVLKSENSKSGMVYFSWGYNRSWYLNSDIHVKDGPAGRFDFTIKDVTAKDRPSKLDWVYLNNPSIPQYNFRLGYWIDDTETFAIEGNFDHMKYVVVSGQNVHAEGYYLDREFNPEESTKLDWLTYEHTDGYNLAIVNAVFQQVLWKNETSSVGIVNRAGGGLMIPRSDVGLYELEKEGEWARINNKFHIAGVGIALETGLRVKVAKYWFAEFTGKAAQVWIQNSLVHGSDGSRASQKITSLELIGTVGFQIPTKRK